MQSKETIKEEIGAKEGGHSVSASEGKELKVIPQKGGKRRPGMTLWGQKRKCRRKKKDETEDGQPGKGKSPRSKKNKRKDRVCEGGTWGVKSQLEKKKCHLL